MRTTIRRSGFTLIEMLVVIAIIAVLAILAVGASFRVLEGQRQSNTETVMETTYSALRQAWAKVVADAKKETPSSATYTLAGGTQYNDRAMVLHIKFRLMEAFPMTYAECNPSTNWLYTNSYIPSGMQRNLSTYWKTLQKTAKSPSGSYAYPNSESSACLLMALSMNRGGGSALNPDNLGSNVTDSDGDGVKEIVDGWGTPFFFFRFPTPSNWPINFLQNSNPNPSAAYADPLDPLGTLADSTWLAGSGSTFTSSVHLVSYSATQTYYVIPVIVSAGTNGKYTQPANPTTVQGLGLKLGTTGTMDLVNPASLDDSNDNIYSFLLRMGGTGN
jgi:prepilin-type N-terminal cleavage/methylation domain-containing protein